MSAVEYMVIALAVIVLFLIYYMMMRESQSTRQIRAIATAVEGVRRDIYTLEKRMQKFIHETPMAPVGLDEEELNDELRLQLQEMSAPIASAMQSVEKAFETYRAQNDERIRAIEEGLRHFSLPASVSGMDDEKIIALYKQGIDVATISKELRLSKPEVEFVLKINKIK